MPQVSARVSDDLNERIEEFSNEIETTKSDALRTLIEQGLETDRFRQENERLKNNLQTLIEDREERENTETIVEYVEDEQQLQRQREKREQRRRTASVLKRGWWWLAGEPN
jgi:metal-responsive CopG/Arc/MetJ family transcriptional regulator